MTFECALARRKTTGRERIQTARRMARGIGSWSAGVTAPSKTGPRESRRENSVVTPPSPCHVRSKQSSARRYPVRDVVGNQISEIAKYRLESDDKMWILNFVTIITARACHTILRFVTLLSITVIQIFNAIFDIRKELAQHFHI